MTWPKHYSLKKEHNKHFEIHDRRDNKTFNVVKKDLHPANQIKIMKMQKFSDGGKVETEEVEVPVSMPDPQKAKEAWQGALHGQSLSSGWQNLKNEASSIFGGQPVKKYSDGGDVVPDYLSTPVEDLRMPPPEEPFLARAGEYVGKVGSKAVSDAMAPWQAIGQGVSSLAGSAGQFLGGVGKGVGIQPSPEPAAMPVGNEVPQRMPQQEEAPPAAPSAVPSAPQVDMSQFPTVGDLKSLQSQQAANAMKEVDAVAEQNKQLAALQEMHVASMQKGQEAFQQSMLKSQNQVDKLSQDIAASKVDPNRYWNSKSTGSKVSSILGILFGGMGAGLQHSTTNMAWEALQNNINKDINAQKEGIGYKQSLLSDNLKIQGNMVQAENATRLQMGAILQGQMAKIAAQTNDPILRAQVQQKIAEMREKQLPLQQNLAAAQAQQVKQQQMKAMMTGKDLQHVDPSTLVEAVVPEHNRKKVYEEIEAAQNTRRMGGSILQAFEEAAKENTMLKTGGGLLRTPASVYALHQAMQPTFKDLEGTVRQAAMDNTFKNITPQPGDSEHTIEQKRRSLTQYLQSKASAPTAKGSGLDLGKFSSTQAYEYAPPPVMRQTSDGRIGLFDPTTKKFLGYK